MAAELKENLAADVQLFPEGKGIFDVVFDGTLIWSKYKTGRFPDSGEVTSLIKD
ncbi:MAG: Rdx family protein [Pseudomonadales bacterium]